MKQGFSLLLILGLLAARAHGAEDRQFVILPGQQAQVETLFGGHLLGGWSVTGLDIGKDSIKVDFEHRDAATRVSLSVRHSSEGVSPRLRTERFSVTVLESSAQPDDETALLSAFEARLRAGESS